MCAPPPGQYQDVLRILGRLEKPEADYVLAVLLAAEKRVDRMRRTIVLEEQELRRFREELRDTSRRRLEKVQAEHARQVAELTAATEGERKRARGKVTAVYERILKVLSNQSLLETTPGLEGTLRLLLEEFRGFFREGEVDTPKG